jgi:hypothetical protein
MLSRQTPGCAAGPFIHLVGILQGLAHIFCSLPRVYEFLKAGAEPHPVLKLWPVPSSLFLFYFCETVFKPRALCLQSRCSIPLAAPPVHFAPVIFGDGVSWDICLGCLWTSFLLISVSQVDRITGVSHQSPTPPLSSYSCLSLCSVLLCNVASSVMS